MREGWKSVQIEDVAKVVNGGTPKTKVADYWGGEHLWITPAEMGRLESPYLTDSRRKLSDAGLQHSSATLVPSHSVVLSTRAPIGHLIINSVPIAFNQGCRGIVPGENIYYKYLYYFLSFSVNLLNDLGAGTTFKELAAGKLKKVALPLPPLMEQKRIVAILDEAFAGISTAVANTERNLANARELFESIVVSGIFGDPDQKGWESAGVEALASDRKGAIRTGPFGSQLLHGEFRDAGVAVLGIDNAVKNEFAWGKRRYISEQKYQQLKRYTVRPRDVIITIMGTCGRCAVVPDNIPLAINTKHLCCITLNKERCLPEFLHCYFLYHPVAREYLDQQAKGSIMAGLNMGIVRSLPVRLPGLEEQAEVVCKIEDLKSQISTIESVYERKLTALADLKHSLLQKAFSGELTAGKEAPTASLKEEEVA